MVLRPPSNLSQEYSFVYSNDPGLDKEHEEFDYEAYLDTGDMKFIPCKEGEAFSIFKLRRMDGASFTETAGPRYASEDYSGRWEGIGQGMAKGVRLSVISAENFPPLSTEFDARDRPQLTLESYLLLDSIDGHDLVSELWLCIIKIARGHLSEKP